MFLTLIDLSKSIKISICLSDRIKFPFNYRNGT
nr:MAG TPA: hypothetical protein [Caudoviricetes sp.]